MPLAPSLFSSLTVESSALVSEERGPDLEYAPHFLAFMASAQGKAEQQLGDAVLPAQAPDWRAVLESGLALAHETRDLRVAVVLTRAAVEVHGLRGLVDGLALILDWLSHCWDTLHPVLEVEGEYDPLMRTNALSYLYAPDGGLKAVRQARLLESRAGNVSVREAEGIVKGRSVDDGTVVTTPEQLARLVADEFVHNQETFAALRQAAVLQQEIESLWKSKLSAEYWPRFEDLGHLLDRLAHFVADRSEAGGAAPGSQSMAQVEVPVEAVAFPLPVAVSNRRDAFQVLALARQYFESHEPTHPAALLIQRIEKLESLNFAQIIAELTPDGLGQLKQLAGD